MSEINSIDDIIANFQANTKRKVFIKRLGVTVNVKVLSLSDLSKISFMAGEEATAQRYQAATVIYGLLNDKGEQIYKSGDMTRVLNEVNGAFVSAVAEEILTGGRKPEDLEKN